MNHYFHMHIHKNIGSQQLEGMYKSATYILSFLAIITAKWQMRSAVPHAGIKIRGR